LGAGSVRANMAGDWIKMSVGLRTSPKVVRISSALRADRLRVIGGLFAVWSVFDAHSPDGLLEGYTLEAMDEELAWPGFSTAMQAVGWLEESESGLAAPRYDTHNGASAKRRAMESERKRAGRDSADCPQDVRDLSASDADKKRTREEKRREEKKTPISPQGGKKSGPVGLKTWLEVVKAKGEKAIPDDDPVVAYAEEVKIPHSYLRLAWFEFVHRYGQPDAKKYRDWRAVFRKAVRGNWLKLWFLDAASNEYGLTTVGHQAQRAHDDRRAA